MKISVKPVFFGFILSLAGALLTTTMAQETNSSSSTTDVAATTVTSTRPPTQDDELAKLVVPINVPSQTVDDAKKQIESDLASIKTPSTNTPMSQVVADQRYILYGSLFDNGNTYALVELQGAVALAQLVKGKWELRGLWNIQVVWRPKGWEKTEGDDFPGTAPTEPFDLIDFSGDGVPEVLCAGDIGRYSHTYYLLKYDAKTNNLSLLLEAEHKPKKVEGYLRLDTDSGHRAIWGKSTYLHWVNDNLVEVGSWRNEVPYNDIDPEFWDAEALGQNGQIEKFRIVNTDSATEGPDTYTITCEGKPYAVVRFKFPKPAPTYLPGMEEDWLFEHLTGLPRKLNKSVDPGTDQPLPHFEDHGIVTVEGNAEAIKRINPQQSDKP